MKIGYLTIDDAPSNDMKRKIKLLKNIKAIWFCRGELLEERPDFAIYAIKKGHIIGNHSYDHPHFSKISLKKCFEQIKETDEIIERIYQKTGIKRPIKVFRFPYGDKGGGEEVEKGWPENKKKHIKAIQDFLKELGYRQPNFENITYKWYVKAGLDKDVDVYWTYDTLDWAVLEENQFGIKNIKDVLARMEENVPEGGRGLNYKDSNDIILMHDFEETKEMFIPMIKKLLTKVKIELPNHSIA